MIEFFRNQSLLSKITISAVLFFLIIVGIQLITKNAEKEADDLGVSQVAKPFKTYKVMDDQSKAKTRLTPSNPADYGIISYSEEDKPKTQQDWNALVHQGYQNTKASLPEETTKAMATRKMSEAKFNERMQELKVRMKVFEDRLEEDPKDQDAADRLEKLKILQAVSEAIKEDVVE